jgi:hypothetical protein
MEYSIDYSDENDLSPIEPIEKLIANVIDESFLNQLKEYDEDNKRQKSINLNIGKKQ